MEHIPSFKTTHTSAVTYGFYLLCVVLKEGVSSSLCVQHTLEVMTRPAQSRFLACSSLNSLPVNNCYPPIFFDCLCFSSVNVSPALASTGYVKIVPKMNAAGYSELVKLSPFKGVLLERNRTTVIY